MRILSFSIQSHSPSHSTHVLLIESVCKNNILPQHSALLFNNDILLKYIHLIISSDSNSIIDSP